MVGVFEGFEKIFRDEVETFYVAQYGVETILVLTTNKAGTVRIDPLKDVNDIYPCGMKLLEIAYIHVFGSAIQTVSNVIWTRMLCEEIDKKKRHKAN